MEKHNGILGLKVASKNITESQKIIQFNTLPFSGIKDGLDRNNAENVFKTMVSIFYPLIKPLSSDYKEFDDHYEVWTDYPIGISIKADALFDICEVNSVLVRNVSVDSMEDCMRIRAELYKSSAPLNYTVHTIEFRQRVISSQRRNRVRRIDIVDEEDSLEEDMGRDKKKKSKWGL